MKPLERDELFQNLQGFLKNKGVELKDGSYAESVQKGCALLSDAINAGQKGVSRAKNEIDKKLDQLRQVIHEKTAPPKASAPPPPPPSPGDAPGKRARRHSAGTGRRKKPRKRA